MIDKKILLADESKFFLEIERKFLEKTDAKVLLATCREEVLSLCDREHPDLICMDVNLPGGGVVCCEQIKNDPLSAHIPVILIHSAASEGEAALCRGSRCDAVLTKPLNQHAFLDTGRTDD